MLYRIKNVCLTELKKRPSTMSSLSIDQHISSTVHLESIMNILSKQANKCALSHIAPKATKELSSQLEMCKILSF